MKVFNFVLDMNKHEARDLLDFKDELFDARKPFSSRCFEEELDNSFLDFMKEIRVAINEELESRLGEEYEGFEEEIACEVWDHGKAHARDQFDSDQHNFINSLPFDKGGS